MAPKAPYRFQMYMDEQLRDVLRDIAHAKRISLTALVHDMLEKEAWTYPQGEKLPKNAQAS